MMDCRKPSAGFIDNMKPDLLKDGMKVPTMIFSRLKIICKLCFNFSKKYVSFRLCSLALRMATPGSTLSAVAWTVTVKFFFNFLAFI